MLSSPKIFLFSLTISFKFHLASTTKKQQNTHALSLSFSFFLSLSPSLSEDYRSCKWFSRLRFSSHSFPRLSFAPSSSDVARRRRRADVLNNSRRARVLSFLIHYSFVQSVRSSPVLSDPVRWGVQPWGLPPSLPFPSLYFLHSLHNPTVAHPRSIRNRARGNTVIPSAAPRFHEGRRGKMKISSESTWSQADGRSPCINGDIAIQWEWSNFDPSQNQNRLTDYDKTLHNWLRPRDERVTHYLCQSTVRECLGKYVKYKALSFFILIYFSPDSPTEATRGRIFT